MKRVLFPGDKIMVFMLDKDEGCDAEKKKWSKNFVFFAILVGLSDLYLSDIPTH